MSCTPDRMGPEGLVPSSVTQMENFQPSALFPPTSMEGGRDCALPRDLQTAAFRELTAVDAHGDVQMGGEEFEGEGEAYALAEWQDIDRVSQPGQEKDDEPIQLSRSALLVQGALDTLQHDEEGEGEGEGETEKSSNSDGEARSQSAKVAGLTSSLSGLSPPLPPRPAGEVQMKRGRGRPRKNTVGDGVPSSSSSSFSSSAATGDQGEGSSMPTPPGSDTCPSPPPPKQPKNAKAWKGEKVRKSKRPMNPNPKYLHQQDGAPQDDSSFPPHMPHPQSHPSLSTAPSSEKPVKISKKQRMLQQQHQNQTGNATVEDENAQTHLYPNALTSQARSAAAAAVAAVAGRANDTEGAPSSFFGGISGFRPQAQTAQSHVHVSLQQPSNPLTTPPQATSPFGDGSVPSSSCPTSAGTPACSPPPCIAERYHNLNDDTEGEREGAGVDALTLSLSEGQRKKSKASKTGKQGEKDRSSHGSSGSGASSKAAGGKGETDDGVSSGGSAVSASAVPIMPVLMEDGTLTHPITGAPFKRGRGRPRKHPIPGVPFVPAHLVAHMTSHKKSLKDALKKKKALGLTTKEGHREKGEKGTGGERDKERTDGQTVTKESKKLSKKALKAAEMKEKESKGIGREGKKNKEEKGILSSKGDREKQKTSSSSKLKAIQQHQKQQLEEEKIKVEEKDDRETGSSHSNKNSSPSSTVSHPSPAASSSSPEKVDGAFTALTHSIMANNEPHQTHPLPPPLPPHGLVKGKMGSRGRHVWEAPPPFPCSDPTDRGLVGNLTFGRSRKTGRRSLSWSSNGQKDKALGAEVCAKGTALQICRQRNGKLEWIDASAIGPLEGGRKVHVAYEVAERPGETFTQALSSKYFVEPDVPCVRPPDGSFRFTPRTCEFFDVFPGAIVTVRVAPREPSLFFRDHPMEGFGGDSAREGLGEGNCFHAKSVSDCLVTQVKVVLEDDWMEEDAEADMGERVSLSVIPCVRPPDGSFRFTPRTCEFFDVFPGAIVTVRVAPREPSLFFRDHPMEGFGGDSAREGLGEGNCFHAKSVSDCLVTQVKVVLEDDWMEEDAEADMGERVLVNVIHLSDGREEIGLPVKFVEQCLPFAATHDRAKHWWLHGEPLCQAECPSFPLIKICFFSQLPQLFAQQQQHHQQQMGIAAVKLEDQTLPHFDMDSAHLHSLGASPEPLVSHPQLPLDGPAGRSFLYPQGPAGPATVAAAGHETQRLPAPHLYSVADFPPSNNSHAHCQAVANLPGLLSDIHSQLDTTCTSSHSAGTVALAAAGLYASSSSSSASPAPSPYSSLPPASVSAAGQVVRVRRQETMDTEDHFEHSVLDDAEGSLEGDTGRAHDHDLARSSSPIGPVASEDFASAAASPAAGGATPMEGEGEADFHMMPPPVHPFPSHLPSASAGSHCQLMGGVLGSAPGARGAGHSSSSSAPAKSRPESLIADLLERKEKQREQERQQLSRQQEQKHAAPPRLLSIPMVEGDEGKMRD
uniref:Uncharacterized protein n=1 Tax=Chromera velia CCMP2878 TaxID=1169474 RepID=A0A0G4I431_9ALVE|eukprot:Cvel_10785.t1-p1 / transcript=Cvel_10785.t1 / gene=Cvel_10785 / organism=Chromera_velia_CCMP2878 / gene_product=hypothetical protein / transcript_product=hypothetical protein / location=Cvel_scaffold659:30611-39442(-) / protein_length=1484 / sequence_SO=supercontig / SO=protein_coding / is_pseudo=false